MYVAEFTLQAKPGHYAEVAALYSAGVRRADQQGLRRLCVGGVDGLRFG
jgi:hypothetical protein